DADHERVDGLLQGDLLLPGGIIPGAPRFFVSRQALGAGPGAGVQSLPVHHGAEMPLGVDSAPAPAILAAWIFTAMGLDALVGMALENRQHRNPFRGYTRTSMPERSPLGTHNLSYVDANDCNQKKISVLHTIGTTGGQGGRRAHGHLCAGYGHLRDGNWQAGVRRREP